METIQVSDLMMIKGIISELPEEDQKKVKFISDEIRRLVQDGKDCGVLAISLVGIEMQQEL